MTLRALIIGTSHAAALRLAWRDHAADWPALTLTFAALQGDVADLRLTGPQLVARDDDARARLLQVSGQDQFDVTRFDVIALCGGTASGFHALRLYNLARCAALPSAARPLDQGLALLSTDCFVTGVTGLIRSASALPLLRALAAVTPARLFAIPHPGLSADALRGSKQHVGFARMARNGDAPALSDLLQQATRRAYDGIATPIPAPDAVRVDGFFTHRRFRRGATRLGADDDVAQPGDDLLHGNADYGRHILTALAAHI